MNNDNVAQTLKRLRDPQTIRLQAHKILDLAKKNELDHFTVDLGKMDSTADFVIKVMTSQYPDLKVPYHSRWRHFEAGGVDRIKSLQDNLHKPNANELGKILYELVIISVFLDAGAGASWNFKEQSTQMSYSRSEGLALASLNLYQQGMLSNDPTNPYRVDAERLIAFNEQDLQTCFQITKDNPLEGAAGRVSLLNRLGEAIRHNTQYFGDKGRLGDFYTYIISLEKNRSISSVAIFNAVLHAFDFVWPVRLLFHGVSLGDVWTHKALKSAQTNSEYIPFHKLSQWLTYSLIEPLEQSGIKVLDIDDLTGLPEYRNGGLLIDADVLSVKNKGVLVEPQEPSSELIIEWRALTVALLDELAELIRKKLHKNAKSLPLAKILQGGTWEAGRRLAKEKRPLGTPPIQIISDGTIF